MAADPIAEIKYLVADQLGFTEDEVKLEHSLREDLGADSLDLLELAMSLEDMLDENVDEEFEEFKTVQELVDLYRRLST